MFEFKQNFNFRSQTEKRSELGENNERAITNTNEYLQLMLKNRKTDV